MSNMYPCKVTIGFENGTYTFLNAEAAFQACKNPNEVERFLNVDGFEAKRIGRKIKLLDSKEAWNARRDTCMELVVRAKFEQNPDLMRKLLKIDGEIVEENTWKDGYWGKYQVFDHKEEQTLTPVFKLVGENKLGQILMRVRDAHKKME